MGDPLSILPEPLLPDPVLPDPAVPSSDWRPGMLRHLTELRSRLLWCLGVSAVLVAISCFYAEPLTRQILALAPKGMVFIQLAPGEAFMASVKISMMVALAFSVPVWLYHTGCFVLPGLHPHEKNALFGLVLGGLALFAGGAAFGLWVVGPQTTDWLVGFGDSLAVNQLSIARYLDFMVMIVVLTGVACELPLVLVGAVLAGLLPKAALLSRWRQGVVGVFLAGAILTPSQDPFSMALVGGVLLGLFGLSMVIIHWLPDKAKKTPI